MILLGGWKPVAKKCLDCKCELEDAARKFCWDCGNNWNWDVADFEAARLILTRVQSGGCQNCGKKKECECVFVG